MRSARESAIRLLQLMMAASVVLPVLLFLVAAALNYRYQQAVADDRIERSLDIVHENALKVFQTGERAIADAFTVVISVAVQRRYFAQFYGMIGRSPGSFYALIRADGKILTRYPDAESDSASDLRPMITQGPGRIIHNVRSRNDTHDERIAYRKL